MKPVALVERAIRNSSKSRDIVLDPFGGSGSTLIACEKTGRQARLIELDPKYCDVIVERWQRLTGKIACSNATFESISASWPRFGRTCADRTEETRFMLKALRHHPLMVGTAEVLVHAARYVTIVLLVILVLGQPANIAL
jgi:hypothetical protein